MTLSDYQRQRAELGQALRDLRWERRAVQLIFRDTRDPDLIMAGTEWLRCLTAGDISLSRKIIALDTRWRNHGELDQSP